MTQRFISESIKPVVAKADTRAMATGGPGLPSEFVWRDKVIVITNVLRTWNETGPCKHGSSEHYVRKHWFEVETNTDQKLQIYFERQGRSRDRTKRWWLFCAEDIER